MIIFGLWKIDFIKGVGWPLFKMSRNRFWRGYDASSLFFSLVCVANTYACGMAEKSLIFYWKYELFKINLLSFTRTTRKRSSKTWGRHADKLSCHKGRVYPTKRNFFIFRPRDFIFRTHVFWIKMEKECKQKNWPPRTPLRPWFLPKLALRFYLNILKPS